MIVVSVNGIMIGMYCNEFWIDLIYLNWKMFSYFKGSNLENGLIVEFLFVCNRFVFVMVFISDIK